MFAKQELLDAADVAERAAKRVEIGWRQRAYSNGTCCDPHDEDATCWCLDGALLRESGGERDVAYRLAYSTCFRVVGDGPINWNDAQGRTQAEVAQALRDTASTLRKEAELLAA